MGQTGDASKFTPEQQSAVSRFQEWRNYGWHSNGDISIIVGDIFYRFNKSGHQVDTWGGGKTTRASLSESMAKHNIQPSLSEDLTESLTVKPPKPAKSVYKYDYKPISSTTICQDRPECCKPREVKAVFWDADHTIWDLTGTAASVTGKLKKINENTVVEMGSCGYSKLKPLPKTTYTLTETEKELLKGLSVEEQDFLLDELAKEHGMVEGRTAEDKPEKEECIRTTISLDPTFRKTLDELEKRNIPSFIISLNTPGSVTRILKEFDLADRFKEIRDSYVNKGTVFAELTQKNKICPCEGMFVDDNRTNTEPVFNKCGIAIQIGKGKDIEKTIDVLKYIKASD
jgi:phosphoglycolate phosphatase-like HAD superfamily hydrolase